MTNSEYRKQWKENNKDKVVAYRKAYIEKNKEKVYKYLSDWRKENRDKVNSYKRKSRQKTDYTNKPNSLFSKYKNSAKTRNYNFSLSIEEFTILINSKCFYCGNPPCKRNGIDRKDNKVGYEIKNCLPCCKVCNKLKGTLEYDDFINKCIQISKELGTL